MKTEKKLKGKIKSAVTGALENSVAEYLTEPIFNIFGNREFFAEGKIRVEKYGEAEIILTVNTITVSLLGRGLCMCFYSRKTVRVTGYITSLSFDKYGRETDN